jgi:hypothetical protein
MIMMDQSKRLREPLPWGRREKTIVAVLLSVTLLALAGLGAYALSGGAPTRAGCIQFTFASTLGGAEVNQCGARARATCATPGAYPHNTEELREACRKAGYPLAGKD